MPLGFLLLILGVIQILKLTLKVPKKKTAKFANRVDSDEGAHYEPPHQDLHCLPSSV